MNTIKADQIIEIEKVILNAIRESDVEILNSLLHENLLFHTPAGEIVTKAMDLASHSSGTMVVDLLEVAEQQISIIDDTAIVSFHLKTKGEMMGQLIEGTFRFLRVWKLCSGNLKVIAGSCIKI